VVWLAVLRFFRMVSLASMCAAVSLPLWILVGCIPRDIDTNPEASLTAEFMLRWPLFVIAVALAVVVIIRHRANISRIMSGTESKVERRGKRRSSPNT
jgi:glycerol-3-phosphate acyltransferase PlsY